MKTQFFMTILATLLMTGSIFAQSTKGNGEIGSTEASSLSDHWQYSTVNKMHLTINNKDENGNSSFTPFTAVFKATGKDLKGDLKTYTATAEQDSGVAVVTFPDDFRDADGNPLWVPDYKDYQLKIFVNGKKAIDTKFKMGGGI